jgi:HK97 gp10 family phage protein
MAKPDALIRAGGASALAMSLRRMADTELSKELRTANKAAAQTIVPHAKKRAPVGSPIDRGARYVPGRLRDSIKADATRRAARIKAGSPGRVPYARYVHAGGFGPGAKKRSKATPFIRKAIHDAWPELIKKYIKGMNKVASDFEKKHGASRVVGGYRR